MVNTDIYYLCEFRQSIDAFGISLLVTYRHFSAIFGQSRDLHVDTLDEFI